MSPSRRGHSTRLRFLTWQLEQLGVVIAQQPGDPRIERDEPSRMPARESQQMGVGHFPVRGDALAGEILASSEPYVVDPLLAVDHGQPAAFGTRQMTMINEGVGVTDWSGPSILSDRHRRRHGGLDLSLTSGRRKCGRSTDPPGHDPDVEARVSQGGRSRAHPAERLVPNRSPASLTPPMPVLSWFQTWLPDWLRPVAEP